MTDLPLQGIRVIDIGISTAGPYAARFLGDLGAEVIKVEPLHGENTRHLGLRYGGAGYLFHVNNYNKKSITLNVQHPKGKACFLKLVAKSDIVIENFSKGTMERWGIGYEDCKQVNPNIQYCSVKGFGLTGPLQAKKAFDTVVQGLTGMMHLTGSPDRPPVKGGPSICDLMTATTTASAAVASLFGPKGQRIETSLLNSGVWTLMSLWPYILGQKHTKLERRGNKHWTYAPYGTYLCGEDGKLLFITVKSDEHWKRLAGFIGLPEAWNVHDRRREEKTIDEAIASYLKTKDTWSAAAILQKEGVPAAPVLDFEQVVQMKHFHDRGIVRESVHQTYGRVPLIQSPLAFKGQSSGKMHRPQPLLGEHNEDVFSGLLHMSKEEMDELEREKVI